MRNGREVDYEAEREGQEFQAKSGVARVVTSYSSMKSPSTKYQPVNTDESRGFDKDRKIYSKFLQAAESSITQFIPVVFAVFINLLDACTFGTVFFPAKFGSDVSGLAIELFLVSTVIVQLVLIKMSSFSCGLGTSMAENIPFIHTMANGIFENLQKTHTLQQMLPTVLVTVCISTIINGILFCIVGFFKLGNVLHFFPRHVIMGMTAGFGVFLISTAVESSTGIVMADATILSFFGALSLSRVSQLCIMIVFEILLRLTEHFKCNELVVPGMMFFLPIAFYIVLAASGTSFNDARGNDWLFPETASANWWDTWKLFDFSLVMWETVALQWTTISSLAFFTLILVPIRIPSLSMITEDEVNFDEELKAQGVANILSGCVGAVHNYLSYSNSIFFFFVGGRGKGSQMAVTVMTLLLFFIGPQIINYVPRLIAGVIMLHLGVDLIMGALISSRKALDSLEYASVLFIATVVSLLGFVPGICMGVVSACATFVVQSSQQSSIRSVFSGDTARSNTSWSSRQRDKLDVGLNLLGGRSIVVVQLQGHLFFGNVRQVVDGIENAISVNLSTEESNEDALRTSTATAAIDNTTSSPVMKIRYVILDCSFVTGADVNAVTGLLKMRDAIATKYDKTFDSSSTHDVAVQVKVIFAGLQSSLEAMFSIQENALSMQKMMRIAKEKGKEKEKGSPRSKRANNVLDNRHCQLNTTNTTGANNPNLHGYADVEAGIQMTSRPSDALLSRSHYEDIALQILSRHPAAAMTGDHQSCEEKCIDQTEISGYNSSHTFDSYSSEGDENSNSNRQGRGSIDDKCADEDDVIAVRRQKARSPSWGSSCSSAVTGHSLAPTSNGEGSVNKPQGRSKKPEGPRRITAISLSTKVPAPAAAGPIKVPMPVRLHPIKRLFSTEGVSEAKSDSELLRLSEVGPYGRSGRTITNVASKSNVNVLRPRPMSRIFYSDVNTALQAVEERIIKSTPLPKKRVSSFYVRRSMIGSSALHHSMSTELTREDVVHSPEASGSSIDDMRKMPRSFSPPPPLSIPLRPQLPSAWAVGPQVYNIENVSTEKSSLLGHGGYMGSPLKFSEYLNAFASASSRFSRNNSFNRLSTHQEVDAGVDTDKDIEESVIVRHNSQSGEISQLQSSVAVRPYSAECGSVSTFESNPSGLTVDTLCAYEGHRRSNSLQEPGLSAPVPRHIPSSPLSPNSRILKLKITNMLFDLSSQWTLGDSSTIKRLARRLRKGVICVRKREVLWESGQDATQMGILLNGRLKAVLRSNNKEAGDETTRTLQVILPGTIFGELGLLSRGRHSRTIIASTDSRIAMLSRDSLDEIEETDKALLCVLQHLALRTAAGRSHELMLFSAGSLGP